MWGEVRCELCLRKFHLDRRELRAAKFDPSHSELGRRSAICVRVGSARAAMSCTRSSSTPLAARWAASTLAEMSVDIRERGGLRPGRRPRAPRVERALRFGDFFRNCDEEWIWGDIWAGIAAYLRKRPVGRTPYSKNYRLKNQLISSFQYLYIYK